MASQLCSEVNGGNCKNKVSARNGFVCAAGHSRDSAVRPTIPISKMNQDEKLALALKTKDKTLQLELLRTGDTKVQQRLADNLLIGEDLQLELFHAGDRGVRWILAQNPSACKNTQLELFHTRDSTLQDAVAQNPSMSRDLAIELAKVCQKPYGYVQNKPLAELVSPENLALLNQYPRAFGMAYLVRLLDDPQGDKEESKALTLHSYLLYEKSGGDRARYYKNKILRRYAGDQEVALILGEASQ